MGKKGSWFSAIRRVFTHNSKEKRVDEPDKKSSSKEKKKGKGILRHETKSFIPLFREPSSIEKILGEADQILIRPPTSLERPKSPPGLPIRPVSPKISSPKAASPRVCSPRAVSPKTAPPRTSSSPAKTFSTEDVSPKAAPPRVFTAGASSSRATAPNLTKSRKESRYVQRPEPTLREQQLSATKIQAAYRGYLARRSFRALKGLVRLQGVVKGQNVKRQTANAMKQMQLLVRVQTQIQSRRIHVLENQALHDQAYKNGKEAQSTLSKWTLNQLSEAGQNEDWDDSSLTKEEAEARLRRKAEAVIKRERAMAYAYSHQLWKSTPKAVQNHSAMRSNGFPWWWNRLQRQLPQVGSSQSQAITGSIMLTPPRPNSEYKPSPSPRPRPQLYASSSNLGNFAFDNHESVTPRSSWSSVPFRGKQWQTTPNRSPLAASSSSLTKYSKLRTSAAYDTPLKDDDSLVSCPPFSGPNYMTPTASAQAKSRANSNPRERLPGTPGSDSNRRFSFPLTPNAASFRSNRDSASQTGMEKRQDSHSIGDSGVDSTASMPAALLGRRPFNRFV